MNILYVTHKDPRVKDGGNELRTHLLWRALQKKGIVYTLVFSFSQEDKVLYEGIDNTICFYNPKVSGHIINDVLYRIITKISGLPILPFASRYADKKIKDLFQGVQFDIVVGRYLHSLQFYHLWKYAPTYIDIDDHPIQVYETIFQNQLPLILRPIGRLVNKFQLKYVQKKISGGWISNAEQEAWCNNHISYLPNIPIIPNSNYNPRSERNGYLLTIGVMSYSPNYLGVDRFLKEIWPTFHAKFPEIKYLIGGKGAPKSYINKWNAIEGVNYLGYIENLNEIYEKCNSVVVPIYAGGGTCIKTLEAMAYSRLCFSTPFGARGLYNSAFNGESSLIVFRDANDFVDQFKKIQDLNIQYKLENNGREFIHEHYSNECFECAVVKVIDKFSKRPKMAY